MVVNFWGVDKFKSAANFCKRPLALYLEQHSGFWIHCQTAARDEDIDLESAEYVPVGQIWKFDLEEHEIRGFGMKLHFFKFRMESVMLSFLATTENIKYKIRTTELQLRENCQINTVGNYPLFPS